MKKWVYFLLILFFLVKVNLIFRYHDTRWDESVFIGMGKYIFSEGESGLWESIRPPGLPLVFGLFWKLGLNSIILSELLSIFFAMGCIYFTYLIGNELYNSKIGFFSALILSVTPVFFYFSSYGFTGIPSTFMALVSIYFFIKKRYFICGVFSAAALLFRFPQGLLLPIFLFWLYIKNKNKIVSFILGWSSLVIPFFIFNLFMYQDMFFPFIEASLHQSNIVYSVGSNTFLGLIHNYSFSIIEGLKQNLLFIFGLFYIFRKKFFIPFLLFAAYFTYIVNKQVRFLLIYVPYLAIMAGYGIYFISKKRKFVLLFICLLLLPSLLSIKTQYFWRSHYIPPVDELHNYFNDKQGVLLTTYPTPVAYSNIKVIPFYNNVNDAISIFNKEKNNVNYILYSNDFYPCYNKDCEKKKEFLFQSIKGEFNLIANYSLDQEYLIFNK